ncbi:CGNR zinc finger domain-containing protein [Streptomyces sp. NPDC059215]|uniref:CGNR zinc finger domain-containing protein n=1 Tax=Streptomyces sp. NPDC059215 TaxID=3346772 RepID=UPI0036B45973
MGKSTTSSGRESAVPRGAAALVDLLNSRAFATVPDELDTPREAAAVLRPFRQGDCEAAPSSEQIALVREIRGTLLNLVSESSPEELARHWSALSAQTATALFRQRFTGPDGAPQQQQVAGDLVTGGIVQAVAALTGDGNWSRLRLCANTLCGVAFYDTSRSRTGRWHSYDACGNRSNVAAYRARRHAPLRDGASSQ